MTVAAGAAVAVAAPAATITVEAPDAMVALVATVDELVTGTQDALIVVEALTGRRLQELRGAVVRDPEWVLNDVGGLTFEMSTHDPALLDCLVDPATVVWGAGTVDLIGHEVEWWRDGQRRWWGPIVSMDVDLDGDTASFQCFDAGWYLGRRFMGAAERRDLLVGRGSMDEAHLPGWIETGACTAARDVSEKVRGVGSALLTGSGAIQATIVHPPTGLGVSVAVNLTAMVRLPASTPVGMAIMTCSVADATGDPVGMPDGVVYVTEDTPLEEWHRVSCHGLLPPGASHRVTATLWSSGLGNTRFDDVRLQKNDATGINAPGADLTQHIVAIMNHVNNGRGKAPFGIGGPVVTQASGTVEVLGIRHAEHTQVLDILRAYTDRDDGIDWWIDPADKRMYVGRRRGVDHTNEVLHQRLVHAGGWVHDETERSSAIVVLGDADDTDRPEGGYTDATATADLVLDHLENPPNGTPLSALDPLARQWFDRLSVPQVTLDELRVPGDMWQVIGPGDVIPCDITSGVLRVADSIRVARVVHDLAADQLVLT